MAERVGVLGAGGMGSAFAAFLGRAGRDVVLIGRDSEHVRAVARNGLTVRPPDAPPWLIAVDACAHAADLDPGSLDALVVLTKAFDAELATRSAARALASDGVAVSLQNGVGLDRALAAAVGGARSLVGTTTVGATLQQPGEISISSATAAGRSQTHLGQLGAAAGGRRAADVAALLTAAGLPAAAHADVGPHVWGKLALAVMSPVSAVLRTTVAGVWASDEGRSLVEDMFDEVVAVASARGVNLDRDQAWAHACCVFEGTGEHYTSMCTDVMKGRRTELASMAGAVRALAADAGIPVPAHSVVIRLLAAAGVR